MGDDSILIMVIMLMMESKRLLTSINDDYVNITITTLALVAQVLDFQLGDF